MLKKLAIMILNPSIEIFNQFVNTVIDPVIPTVNYAVFGVADRIAVIDVSVLVDIDIHKYNMSLPDEDSANEFLNMILKEFNPVAKAKIDGILFFSVPSGNYELISKLSDDFNEKLSAGRRGKINNK